MGIVDMAGRKFSLGFIVQGKTRVSARKFGFERFENRTWYLLTDSGWSTTESMIGTIRNFRKELGHDEWYVLLMDIYRPHINAVFKEEAVRLKFIIVYIPPSLTDQLQPLDVAVFGPFKSILAGLYHKWLMAEIRAGTEHPKIDAAQMTSHLVEAWRRTSATTIVSSWSAVTGNHPVQARMDDHDDEDDPKDPDFIPDEPEEEEDDDETHLRPAVARDIFALRSGPSNITIIQADKPMINVVADIVQSYRGDVNVVLHPRTNCAVFMANLISSGIRVRHLRAGDLRVGWAQACDDMRQDRLDVVTMWPENIGKVAFGRDGRVWRFIACGGTASKEVVPFSGSDTYAFDHSCGRVVGR
jgi:hypothetical protein